MAKILCVSDIHFEESEKSYVLSSIFYMMLWKKWGRLTC